MAFSSSNQSGVPGTRGDTQNRRSNMVEVRLGSATADVDSSMSSESGLSNLQESIVAYTYIRNAAESSIYSRPLNCSPLQLILTAISRGDPSTKDHRSTNINSSIPNIMQPYVQESALQRAPSSTEGAKLSRADRVEPRRKSGILWTKYDFFETCENEKNSHILKLIDVCMDGMRERKYENISDA